MKDKRIDLMVRFKQVDICVVFVFFFNRESRVFKLEKEFKIFLNID